MGQQTNYFESLKEKTDNYVPYVYSLSDNFPKHELFGCTSQLRRSTLSVILNFVEGYARKKVAVKRNFWEISYGSLKESKYLVSFCYKRNYITKEENDKAVAMAEQIGAMLWRTLEPISES